MTLLISITKGKALLLPEGLRCGSPRDSEPDRRCNKLLVKRSARGQIAGNFLCKRCGQEIEVSLVEAKSA